LQEILLRKEKVDILIAEKHSVRKNGIWHHIFMKIKFRAALQGVWIKTTGSTFSRQLQISRRLQNFTRKYYYN